MVKKLKNLLIRSLVSLFRPYDRSRRPALRKRFLLVSTTGVGDTLWGTPAIRALKETFPDSFVGMLTNQLGAELLQGNIFIDRFHIFRRGGRGLAGLFRDLRTEQYDTVFVFHASDRIIYPLIALTGATEIIGYREDCKGLESLLTTSIALPPDAHGITRRLLLMDGCGVTSRDNSLALYLSAEEKLRADNILQLAGVGDKKLLLIHPGAQKPYKCWPAASFAKAAMELVDKHGFKVIITGNDKEMPLADEVARGISGAINLAGSMTLRETAAVVERCSLMLTNDTGPMHIAFALGTPTVALFGPTDPALCGPAGAAKAIVVKGDIICAPCIGKKCQTPRCLEQIPVTEVVKAAEILLKEISKP